MRKIIAVLGAVFTVCMSLNAVYAQTDCITRSCIYLPLLEQPAATPEPTTTPIPSKNVVAVNTSAFEPFADSKSVYLVGEVRNETASIVQYVKITAILRDASGKIVDDNYAYSDIDKLTAGLISPFRIIFTNPPAWTSYELTVTWSNTDKPPVELQVINPETFFDSSNAYHVRGTVRNQSSAQRTYVKIILTMYNSAGKVIGEEYDYTNPTTVEPGQEVLFDISAFAWAGKPDRDNVVRSTIRAFDD